MLQARLVSYPDAHRYRLGVNYEPNSFGGPREDVRYREMSYFAKGEIGRFNHRQGNDDYSQAGDLYRLMTVEQKDHLIHNIVTHMAEVAERIKKLQISHFAKADPDYGKRVADGLGLAVSQEELVGAK